MEKISNNKSQELRNGTHASENEMLRNNSQKLRNEAQAIRSSSYKSQELRSKAHTSENESQVLRDKSQNLRNQTQAIRSSSHIVRNELSELRSEAEEIRSSSYMARKESQELRSNEETCMLKIKNNKSSSDLDVDLDVPLFQSIKSSGDDDSDYYSNSDYEFIEGDKPITKRDKPIIKRDKLYTKIDKPDILEKVECMVYVREVPSNVEYKRKVLAKMIKERMHMLDVMNFKLCELMDKISISENIQKTNLKDYVVLIR